MQENIKQIKDQLIINYFDKNEYIEINDLKYYKPITPYSFCIVNIDYNIFMQISESGNLIFAFQHYEKNRNEIKNILNDYLNKNVFHNLILKDKLEDKLPQKEIKNKEKVKKI